MKNPRLNCFRSLDSGCNLIEAFSVLNVTSITENKIYDTLICTAPNSKLNTDICIYIYIIFCEVLHVDLSEDHSSYLTRTRCVGVRVGIKETHTTSLKNEGAKLCSPTHTFGQIVGTR